MQSSHETLNVVQKKQAEVGIEEKVVTDDTNRGKTQVVVSDGEETQKAEHPAKKDSSTSDSSSSSSESEDEAGEYRPPQLLAQDAIKEELEEKEDEEHRAQTTVCVEISRAVSPNQVILEHKQVTEVLVEANEVPRKVSGEMNLMKLDNQDLKEEQLKLNGEASHIDIDVSPQIICCSEVNGRRGRATRLAMLF